MRIRHHVSGNDTGYRRWRHANIRAICAAVFRPEITASAISRRLVSSSFLRRPPMRPSARAAARPAEVRSRIMARSNSAKAPTIYIIIRPAGVVVSICSVSERKPAPASPIFSMMCSRSFSEPLYESRSMLGLPAL
jgi:hypothetical protein